MIEPQERPAQTDKAPPPELRARAPRPRPVRIRRTAALALGAAAAAVVGGALIWSFVVSPQLRTAVRHPGAPAKGADGVARPSELIAARPATYASRPDGLPPPRRFGEAPAAEPALPPRAARPRPATDASHAVRHLGEQARRSSLLFPASGAHTFPGRPPATPPLAQGIAPSRAGGLTAPASPFEVKAGAVIPAALLTALDTSRPGAVVAITTEAVFDTVTGRILLVPQGARLIGRQDGASKYGDRRAFLIWERLILPNGKSLRLADEPAVDAAGAHGVRGEADRRLGPLARASLFASAITTLGLAARERDGNGGGLLGDAGDAAAIQAAQVGGRLIGRELDVAPSIRMPSGSAVRVLVTHDLTLEPYAP